MTPLENQFRLPEYTIPGEYFTPLTSPALEAQNADSNSYQYHARQVSDVGFVPTTADMNSLAATAAPGSPSTLRKPNTRRRGSTASNRLSTSRKVKQSPNILAQRKRSTLATNSEEFYNSLTQELNSNPTRLQNQDIRSLQTSSNEASGQDSVSPEPLSEPLMPPPALPAPRVSPAITPHSSSPGGAATPALLMRIQRTQHSQDPSGQFRGQAQLAQSDFPDEIMEDISLPEAAAPQQQRPKPNRIDTAIRTPSISTNGTPLLAPSPAAYDQPHNASIAPSPRTAAMPSPSGPVPRRSESRAASNRKRGSMSSTHASPQLRPKISPSIQPLMKGSEGEQSPLQFLGPILTLFQACLKMLFTWHPNPTINISSTALFHLVSAIRRHWPRTSAQNARTTSSRSRAAATESITRSKRLSSSFRRSSSMPEMLKKSRKVEQRSARRKRRKRRPTRQSAKPLPWRWPLITSRR